MTRFVITDVDFQEVVYDEIVIEDLNEDHSHEGIALDVKNRQRYFEGRAAEAKDSSSIDTSDLLQMMGNGVGDWKTRLVSVRSVKSGGRFPLTPSSCGKTQMLAKLRSDQCPKMSKHD